LFDHLVLHSFPTRRSSDLFLRVWRGGKLEATPTKPPAVTTAKQPSPWLPWVLLSVIVFLWGLPNVKAKLDAISAPKLAIPGLDRSEEHTSELQSLAYLVCR